MFTPIDPAVAFAVQNKQYAESLLLNDIVEPGTKKLGKVSISNLGHFLCQRITGSYTTIEANPEVPAEITDTGIVYLRGKLIDGSNQRALFNDYIPLNLFLSPGRTRSAETTQTPVPDDTGLFYPIELNYLFTINSDILLEVYNSSNVAQEYNIMFHGMRIREVK